MRVKQIVVGDLETNCYLLESKEGLVIIDPGGDTKQIVEVMGDRILEVKYIINTHGHGDHTLANGKIKKVTGAKILIHEAEKRLIDFHVDQYLHEDDIICAGDIKLKVIHTPGHTPGGICLLGDNFIFTGDTIFKDGQGRTDLPGGSDVVMQQSLRRLQRIIKPDMIVYPGHGEIFRA